MIHKESPLHSQQCSRDGLADTHPAPKQFSVLQSDYPDTLEAIGRRPAMMIMMASKLDRSSMLLHPEVRFRQCTRRERTVPTETEAVVGSRQVHIQKAKEQEKSCVETVGGETLG